MFTQRLVVMSLLLVCACGGGGDDRACVPGASASCTGEGGCSGFQTCNAAGTGFDACECDAPDAGVDASVDALPATCDPLAAPGQQGCATGQKCTWIQVADTPSPLGKLGCVPDGTVALGGTCMHGAVGETTGYDDCVAGAICIGTTCQDICGFDTNNAQAACAVGDACTRYADLFENGEDEPVAGACNPTCDPLTQTVQTPNGTTNCGAGKGCYLLASTVDTIAVCASAGTPTHNQPITGTPFANSCAPGHMPRSAVQGLSQYECGALCKPADVYMNNNEAYEGGDTTAVNWMNQPATCVSAGGTTVAPGVPTTGESCQYYWTREPSSSNTRFSNTLGWCFNYASWQYDLDGAGAGTTTGPWPRCITLGAPPSDTVPPMDGTADTLYFGCTAQPGMLVGKAPLAPRLPMHLDRLQTYH